MVVHICAEKISPTVRDGLRRRRASSKTSEKHVGASGAHAHVRLCVAHTCLCMYRIETASAHVCVCAQHDRALTTSKGKLVAAKKGASSLLSLCTMRFVEHACSRRALDAMSLIHAGFELLKKKADALKMRFQMMLREIHKVRRASLVKVTHDLPLTTAPAPATWRLYK